MNTTKKAMTAETKIREFLAIDILSEGAPERRAYYGQSARKLMECVLFLRVRCELSGHYRVTEDRSQTAQSSFTQVGNFRRGVANGYDWLAMAALLALGVVFFYFEVDRIPVGR